MEERFSEYRIMWLFVFFDLPTETKQERKVASDFRKRIQADGFTMMQFSVYVRHCASSESADVHTKRVKGILPEKGQVSILRVTDKQFGGMEVFMSAKELKKVQVPMQLELF